MNPQLPDVTRLTAALGDQYIIKEELGRGGMATVYLADDVKHERRVALKVLRSELATVLGPDRFLREIKLTARLSHPHILGLLDSGDVGGFPYYVMPFVEGETLRQKLNRETQVSVDDALRYTVQVASALHYAHEQGVMHRDIKPENILLHAGEAMVADFGIALALDVASGDRLTETGLSIGTPEYMSPEQASGARQLDARSDVYALGCVLYEMLTGDPPFTGQTSQAIIARQVLDPPPNIRSVRSSVSEDIEAVVQRALAKTPSDRWQTAQKFAAQLEAAGKGIVDLAPVRAKSPAISRAKTVTIGIVGLGAVVITAVMLTLRSAPDVFAPLATPTQVTLTGRSASAAISPDGEYVAYGERTERGERIIVQDVAGGAGLELGSYVEISSLQWSPNGSDLLVAGTADRGGRPGVITVFSRFGGDGRRLPRGAVFAKWSPNGQRIVVWWMDIKRLGVIDSFTGDSVSVPLPERFGFVVGLDWSPDGTWFAIRTDRPGGPYQIWTVADDGSKVHEIVRDTAVLAGPVWVPDGRGIYYLRRNGATADLMAVDISTTGQSVGEPVRLLSGVPALNAAGEFVAYGQTSMSSAGTRFLFARDESRANIWTVSPLRAGAPATQRTRGTAVKSFPRVSPTGDVVAYLEAARGRMDVWIDSLRGADARPLTFDGIAKHQLAWSPDGRQLAYAVRGAGGDVLHTVDMDGVIRAHPETTIGSDLLWPEERAIIYNPGSNDQLFRYDLSDRSTVPLLARDGFKFSPRVSSNGQYMAFYWNRPGANNIDLWILETDTELARRLDVGRYFPIGWGVGGTQIFALPEWISATVYAIDVLEGVVRPLVELPLATTWQQIDFHPGTETVVTALTEEQVDIWMLEDFDPRHSPTPRR